MKPWKDTGGYTLMELVCAVLILAMIGGTIVLGVGAGVKAQRQNGCAADCRSYSELLGLALEERLHYGEYEGTEAGEVCFSCPGLGIERGRLLLVDGALCCRDGDGVPAPIIDPALFPELRITEFALRYEEETGVFAGHFTLTAEKFDFSRREEFAVRTVYRMVRTEKTVTGG